MRALPLRSLVAALPFLLAACGSDPADDPVPEPLPPPGEFQAGVAELKMPVPLGIGTMGFGGIGQPPSVTPFADMYPGTTRQHTSLTLRAVALTRGEHYQLVLVRMDTVGVFQHLREAVLDELERRRGVDLDQALVLAGNHSHSGPGRLIMPEAIYSMLADYFLPEFYERMVSSLADVVEAALDDLAPAELATGLAESSDAHNDRRCENNPLDQVQERPDIPIVAIRRNGTLDALVLSYAYHGTILDINDLTLSGDMGGTAERKISESFDHPVKVLLFNSWGADMAPGDPGIPASATGADQPEGYDRMEGLGAKLAATIVPQLESLSYTTEPSILGQVRRVPLSREAIGYGEEEFPYPNGGVYCGGGSEGNCEAIQAVPRMDQHCLTFSKDEPAPKQTLFLVGRLGDLTLISAPGEWGTALADGVVQQASSLTGGGRSMFVGYANDYVGYLVGEQDWWQGGYEAAGGMWGPRQGAYLQARAIDSVRTLLDPAAPLAFAEPAPIAAFSGYTFTPYQPESPVSPGTIQQDAPAQASPTDVVSVTVLGGDPWLGTPIATLERKTAGGFEPVARKDGSPVTSDGYEMWIDLAVNPPYDEVMPASEREFAWTFHVPIGRRVEPSYGALSGTYRLRVELPTDGAGATVVAESAEFTVE